MNTGKCGHYPSYITHAGFYERVPMIVILKSI
ncbi:MAG: hypothetical protein XE11_1128 [Methanomicrobiales archaeon 53_19]|jgi:hypothetical protein|nr:MAG: hypothetical protein XE11_1128 [Methanomicrobiales archaeon 53_19]